MLQVIVGENMTSRELVWLLLAKYRMRHRDPKVAEEGSRSRIRRNQKDREQKQVEED